MTRSRLIAILMVLVACLGLALPVLAEGSDEPLTFFAEDYVLASGETYVGDILVIAGSATIKEGSTLEGTLALIGGEATIAGYVDGDVIAMGGSVDLDSTAEIMGDLAAVGALRRHAGAVVHGTVIEGAEDSEALSKLSEFAEERQIEEASPPTAMATVMNLARVLITFIAVVGVSILVILLLPENTNNIGQVMTQSGLLSLAVGVVTLLLTAVLLPLLVIICIGIPIALFLILALVVVSALGWATAGRLIGCRVLNWTGSEERRPAVVTLLGVGLLTALSMVPCLGWAVALLALSWGIGAVILSRLGTRSDAQWGGQDPRDPCGERVQPPVVQAPPSGSTTQRLDPEQAPDDEQEDA